MSAHQFIFEPGEWIGYGTLAFAEVVKPVRFYTKWKVSELKNERILCDQAVEIEESSETLHNKFQFSNITATTFDICLMNEIVGLLEGTGRIEGDNIIWEFQDKGAKELSETLAGIEVYSLQNDGTYFVNGEYLSDKEVGTRVEGRIWKKI